MSTYTKYIDALAKMDEVVEVSKGVKWEYDAKNLPDPVAEVHAKWDELYEFIYANFKAPVSRRDEADEKAGKSVKESLKAVTPEVEAELVSMREMFSLTREEIEAQLYEIPPVILEQCFPVWIARYLLCFVSVPVSPVNLTTFNEFHNMYGYMVIYCQDF